MDALDAVAWTKKIKGRPWRLAFLYLRALEKQRVEKDVVLCNTAITCCEEEAQWQTALQLLSRFEGISPSVVSIGAVISTCETSRQWLQAYGLHKELQERQLEANAICRSSLLSACGGMAWHQGLELLEADLIAINSATSACGEVLEWEKAIVLFDSLQLLQLRKSIVSGSAVIKAQSDWHRAYHFLQ